MEICKAISKQLFGAKYEEAIKSLVATVILFLAIYNSELRIEIAPFILYLISFSFTAGIMWQMLNGRQHMENLQGLFMLPFKNHLFVFSYVLGLSMNTLITKTFLIWSILFSIATWSMEEITLGVLCGCVGSVVSAASYKMYKENNIVIPVLWVVGFLCTILFVRQPITILFIDLVSVVIVAVCLYRTDAYIFYSTANTQKINKYTSSKGNVFIYLIRYLKINKSYLINTIGLCGSACLFPLMLSGFPNLNLFPIGLPILYLNTPICTLLSCDKELEQSIRVLPRQVQKFCVSYWLFIFVMNGLISSIYLISWHLNNSGINFVNVATMLLFDIQSSTFSVMLEWVMPVRNWKTESDLWHHPRKYIIPVLMFFIAILIGAWPWMLWCLILFIIIECCVLVYMIRRQ